MRSRNMMLVIMCSCAVISCSASHNIPPEWGKQDKSYSTSSYTGCPSMEGQYRNQAEWAVTNPELLPGISSRDKFNLAVLFQFGGDQSEIETLRLTQSILERKLLVSFLGSYGRNVGTKEFNLNSYGKNISVQCNRDSIAIRYSVVTPTQTEASFFDHKTIYLDRSNDGSLIATVIIHRSPAMLLVSKLSYVEYLLRFKIVKT